MEVGNLIFASKGKNFVPMAFLFQHNCETEKECSEEEEKSLYCLQVLIYYIV